MRVAVVGSPCSGKSFFAERLSAATRTPLIRLDDIYWGPRWSRPDEAQWLHRLERELALPAWIADGNYASTLSLRFRLADLVIYMKTSTPRCLVRFAVRGVRIAMGEQALLPQGVPGRSPSPFAPGDWLALPRKIVSFARLIEPQILEEARRAQCAVVVVHSITEANLMIAELRHRVQR